MGIIQRMYLKEHSVVAIIFSNQTCNDFCSLLDSAPMSDVLQPIPTPPGRLVRDIVQRGVPPLVFMVVCIIVIKLWTQRMGPTTIPAEVDTIKAVITAPQQGMVLAMRVRDLQEVSQNEILGQIILADQKTVIEFKAPIKGRVGIMNKGAGELVQAGDALFTIAAPMADRMIGYLRQPISVDIKTNQLVNIRARSLGQQVGTARITKIGSELLPIRKSLLPPAHDRDEVGLPVFFTVPTNLVLYPGEIVDITFLPSEPARVPPAVVGTNAPTTNKPAGK
ncbi:MAG: HlyD family efflux transporter periplasmic adaptor subunit [Pedosphaera sp.]|nr:HlyD family efflux transporter periplasmic adaptor subunit [Pedosphaera sp.]